METFSDKNVIDICAFQETKRDKSESEELGYRIIFFDRGNQHHGQGFPIKKNLKTVEAKTVTDRICILTIEKRGKWAMRDCEENRKTIFKTDIKKNRLVLINCYAPHMGITAINPEEMDHRLVAVKLHRKLNWERGKAKKTKRATEDPVLLELKTKQKNYLPTGSLFHS